MMSLQEYLDQKYPTKADKESVTKISVRDIYRERQQQGISELLQGGELDLKGFQNLEKVDFDRFTRNNIFRFDTSYFEPLTKLILGDCPNLTLLYCSYNNLTSVDFLEELVCPEKLICLRLCRNNIESTDIEVFSKFTNLETLWIGKSEGNKRNHFFGSFKSWINLTKLKSLDIADTDIDSGLEYLPIISIFAEYQRLVKDNEDIATWQIILNFRATRYPNAKCERIWEQLEIHNFSLKDWFLSNPEKVLLAQPELFVGEQQEEWLTALRKKSGVDNEVLEVIRIIINNLWLDKQDLEQKLKNLEIELQDEREAHLDGILAAEDWYTVQIPKQIQQKRSNCQEQGGSLTIADYQAQIEITK